MMTAALLISLINSFTGVSYTDFESFKESLHEEDQIFIEQNNIDSFDEMALFFDEPARVIGDDGQTSQSISELEPSGYLWSDYYVVRLENISGASPVEIGGPSFPESDISYAIMDYYNTNTADYGGCGPRAAMGVFDYLARTVHYYEFLPNPNNSASRIGLAELVFSNSNVYHFGNFISMTYSDYTSCINGVISQKNLSSIIGVTDYWTLTGGHKDYYFDQISQNLKKGLPVTISNFAWGTQYQSPSFYNHISNIVGVVTRKGVNATTGETVYKHYLEGVLNRYQQDTLACTDAHYFIEYSFLDTPFIAMHNYQINYNETYSLDASNFQSFVNSQGQGQYFYYEKYGTINLDSYYSFHHKRLRCSYILDQYLVLSPKRVDAGQAYLTISPVTVWSHYMSFDAALWSDFEDEAYEHFYIKYYCSENGGTWKTLLSYNLNSFSLSKDILKHYYVLLPRDARSVGFFAVHDYPSGTYNRGRIVLDNITIKGRN